MGHSYVMSMPPSLLCAINTPPKSGTATASPTPLVIEPPLGPQTIRRPGPLLQRIHLMITQLLPAQASSACTNPAVSSAVSEMLICQSSWALTIEKHSLSPKRKDHLPSCSANRLYWCLCISALCSFSTELSTKKLTLFIWRGRGQ